MYMPDEKKKKFEYKYKHVVVVVRRARDGIIVKKFHPPATLSSELAARSTPASSGMAFWMMSSCGSEFGVRSGVECELH